VRLAIITTHPIQYYAPMFKKLAERSNLDIMVFYTWGEKSKKKFDPGFNKVIDWDISLLDGYSYVCPQNTAKNPGSHHFFGTINPDLIKQIESWQANALLIFGWSYYSHLKVMRYFKGIIPIYFRGDSTLLDEKGGLKSILKRQILIRIYQHIDHAFYVGTNNKKYFKNFGLNDEQLSFAPHAVDNVRFAVDRELEVVNLRNFLGIGTNKIVILFVGKLEEKKSPGLLLDAFLMLNESDLHLIFVGDGQLKASLQEKCEGIENVHFLGFQNQSVMPVIYQASDLLCLPSKGPGETWGLVVNEAMVCKNAIVVSDKCGCAIDLVSKRNGIIFSNENISELGAALKSLTSNPQKLNELGNQSATIIKTWNIDDVVLAIEKKILKKD
jgi:glycosyltransferase involved in cell wall biosynthesis